MKKIAGSLRLDLAAFRELEAFAQLGTDLDDAAEKICASKIFDNSTSCSSENSVIIFVIWLI